MVVCMSPIKGSSKAEARSCVPTGLGRGSKKKSKQSSKMKENGKRKRKEKGKKNRKAPLIMKTSHHSTFAHLIYDALRRLNCSPHPPHHVSSKRAIVRNIEEHYSMKLGKKFHRRLDLSLASLVDQGKIIPRGNNSAEFRLSPEFAEHFAKLKGVDRGPNRRSHDEIQSLNLTKSYGYAPSRSRSPSRSGRRSKKRRHRQSPSQHGSESPKIHRSKSRGKMQERSKSKSSSPRSSGRYTNSKKDSKGYSLGGWRWPTLSGRRSDAPQAIREADETSRNNSSHIPLGLRRILGGFKRGRSRERTLSRSKSRQSSRGESDRRSLDRTFSGSKSRQRSRGADRRSVDRTSGGSKSRQRSRGADRRSVDRTSSRSKSRQRSRGPERRGLKRGRSRERTLSSSESRQSSSGEAGHRSLDRKFSRSKNRQRSRGAARRSPDRTFSRSKSRQRSRGADHRSVDRTLSRSKSGPSSREADRQSHSLGLPCRCNASALPHHHGPSNPVVPKHSSLKRSKGRVTKVSSLIDNPDHSIEDIDHDSESLEDAGDAHWQTSSHTRHFGKQEATSATAVRRKGRYINPPLTSSLKHLLES